MSQSKERPSIAVVRAVYDAFATKDIPRIISLFSPDVELAQSTEVPWGGEYHGHEGALKFFGILTQTIKTVVSIERYIDAGDTVIAIGWTRGTVNATGARIEVPIAHVWTINDDLATRVHFCIDNPTMLSALEVS